MVPRARQGGQALMGTALSLQPGPLVTMDTPAWIPVGNWGGTVRAEHSVLAHSPGRGTAGMGTSIPRPNVSNQNHHNLKGGGLASQGGAPIGNTDSLRGPQEDQVWRQQEAGARLLGTWGGGTDLR